MARRGQGSKERIRQYLRAHVGETVTGHDLRDAIGSDVTEWARRLRELRTQEGWDIRSHNDDSSLRPGEYRLVSLPEDSSNYVFPRSISGSLRAQVLERNGYTCQMCGVGAGDPDERDPTRKVRLHVGHIVDKIHGGQDVLTNLRALCSTCNEGAKDLAQEPPSWTWLMSQVRRASVSDQQRILDWLRRKFDTAPE